MKTAVQKFNSSKVQGSDSDVERLNLEQRQARLNPEGLREELLRLVGAPYGDPRFEPADCWGFVRYAYSLAGVELPKSIWRARHSYREVHDGKVEPLDVIYFRSLMLEQRHVAIAIDQLYILQSSKMTNGVSAIRLNRAGIRESVQGIYRLK